MKVIITGASQGIGKAIADVLSQHGHSVGLIARSEKGLQALKIHIEARGGHCAIAPCDLRSWEKTQAAIQSLLTTLSGVDALINNAGLVIRKPIMDVSLDDWHAMVETNINGSFYATRALLPHLQDKKQGHIIMISSISGRVPLAGGSAYAASKYAVTGFAESLFLELRQFGIKVSTIFPGSVDTTSPVGQTGNSWQLSPEDIGNACQMILSTPANTLISRLEIRPLHRP